MLNFAILAQNTPSDLIGDFDILLNINGVDQHAASTQIFGTNGKSTRVKLNFQIDSSHDKALIQTRVFSIQNTVITAYFFELNYE